MRYARGMRSSWLSLALAATITGCFDAHGTGPDAGPLVDAPVMCELRAASVLELSCPSVVVAGTAATITVTTAPVACCSSGTVRSRVRRAGTTHTVSLEWDACDCCEGCRCIGPIEEVTVGLGELEAGSHRVEVHGSTCVIEALPPTGVECGPPFASTEFLAPRHLYEGQEYPVTLTSEPASSCSCTPRVTGAETLSYALELCDCCDACECIDPGYQASHVRAPLPIGTHLVGFPHGSGEVTVHAYAECRPIDVTNVVVVPPRRDLVTSGPALTWVAVEGEEWLCCAEPAPVVDQLDTTEPGIALRLSSCVNEDCDCVPTSPTTARAWYSLGELPAGTYSLRAGEVATTFTVD